MSVCILLKIDDLHESLTFRSISFQNETFSIIILPYSNIFTEIFFIKMNSVLTVPFSKKKKKNVNKIEISNWIIWVYMYIYVVKLFYLCFFSNNNHLFRSMTQVLD